MTKDIDARGPERIWLEPEAPHDCYGELGRTWCDTPDEWDVYDGNHPVEYMRADLAPDPLADPRVVALVSSVKDLRDILDRNLIEREGPNTVTLPDGTTHDGPVVDFLHDLLRVQIRALDAALAALSPTGGNADG